MEDERRYRKYRVYSGFIRWCLANVGLVVHLPVHADKRNFLKRTLPFVALSLFSFVMFGFGHFTYHNFSDVTSLTKVISIFGSTSSAFLKVVLFCVYRDRLHELYRLLDGLFEECLRNSARRKSAALCRLGEYYLPTYVLFYTTFGIMLTYAMVPLVLIFVQMAKNVSPRRYILPLVASFPWEIQGFSANYVLHYLLEIATTYFIVFVTCGVDTLFGYYVFQMSAILRALSVDLEDISTQRLNSDVVFQSCVKKHAVIMRCRGILQDVYGPIVFWMTISSALIMCGLVFQAFQTTLTFGKLILFIFYMSMKMAQTFMYSWYGSTIGWESEAFQEAVYFGNWWNFYCKSTRKTVTLILSQRRLRITALYFFNVSMDLFLGILNTTLSYFFLLKTLMEAE